MCNMKYTKFLIPIILYITLFVYTEFQETESAIPFLYLMLTLYFLYLLTMEYYSKKSKEIYYGFLIGLLSFIIVNIVVVFLYLSVGVINNDNPAANRYIGSYNNEQYFYHPGENSSFTIGIYKLVNDELILHYELEEDEEFRTIVAGKFLILLMEIHESTADTSYYLVDIETEEISLIPLDIVAPNIKSITDSHIIFYGYLINTYYIYEVSSNTIIYEYVHSDESRRIHKIYYFNNKLYLNDYREHKIEVYNFDNDTLNEINIIVTRDVSYLSNLHIRSIDLEIFIYRVYYKNSNEKIIIKSDDSYNEISEFIIPDGYVARIIGDKIYLSSNSIEQGVYNFKVYDLDFNFINSIGIESICGLFYIIDEETIQCSNYEYKGALYFRIYKETELFDTSTGESIYDSGWINGTN